MLRSEVIQRCLKLFPHPRYVEIGVNQGETFNAIQAATKVAIDPQFLFDTNAYATDEISFHEMTSDAYFASTRKSASLFDVAYIDGLHTFEQTLRDLLNITALLSHNGIVIIDDVLPSSYDAALPDLAQVMELRRVGPESGSNWFCDGSWMGDVFKLVFFIETFMQQFDFATVAENHGQTIVWRGPRPAVSIPHRSVEDVSRLDYRDTILKRSSFRPMPMDEIMARIAAARMVQSP